MLNKSSILMLLIVFTLVFASVVTAEEHVYQIYNTPEEYEAEVGKTIDVYNEAPVLADLVAKGELEPVEDRLPKNPIIIEPSEKIGSYGGTWDMVWKGVSDQWGISHPIGESFVDWSRDITARPNVVRDWEITNDNKTVIFYMREGIKWSDGEPLTADDAQFYYENMISNQDLNPAFPSFYIGPDGEKAEFTKIDDYTFKFDFPANMAQNFIVNLPRWGIIRPLVAPKHYLEQFHPDFVSEREIEAKVEDAGVDTWADLFDNKNNYLMNHERPVLLAWRVVTENTDATQFILERNPYYWKVDAEGNQLPYIDRIRMTLAGDSEVITMKALTGDIDQQYRHFTLNDYPVLKEREEQGGYKTMLTPSNGGGAVLMPNQNLQDDPVKKEIYQNKKFRYALSLAIDREEVNEMNYLGLAKPMQASYAKASPFYDEEWANAYVDYNPDKAREILDEIGLDKKDSEGFRLRPDGKRLRVTLNYCLQNITGDLELVKNYFEKVGIETRVNMMDRSLYVERIQSAAHDIAVWQIGFPIRPDLGSSFLVDQYARLWVVWNQTDGEKGEEPPVYVKKLQELHAQLSYIEELDKKKEIVGEAVDILSDQLFQIGIVGETPQVGVAKTNMKNITYDGFMYANLLKYEALALPQTFFFEE